LTIPITSESTLRIFAVSWEDQRMRGLALCLVAGAIAVAGCGSDDSGSPAQAPNQETVAASGGTAAPAGVSAKGRATVASLCTAEGKGKPKKQCVAGLTKLDKGKVANPRAACKGLSKKKTKGVRGKSPYAVCVKAAAKLMASKHASSGSANGEADAGAGDADDSPSDDDTSTGTADAAADDDVNPSCRDSKGNEVASDDEDVEECDLPGASDDSGDSGSADDSADDEDGSSDDE
jgi:hypothetical protein